MKAESNRNGEYNMNRIIYIFLLMLFATGNNAIEQDTSSVIPKDLPRNYSHTMRRGEGRLQGHDPKAGLCWMNAIGELPPQCSEINDIQKGILAMKLANCHFEVSGLKTYDCTNETNFKQCISNVKAIDNSSFLVYTQYLTHVTDICFHLQNETWRQKPAKIIALMSQTTEDATAKLDHSSRIQEIVLHNQMKLVMIQEENAQRAKNAKKTLSYLKNTSEYTTFYTVAFALCYVVTNTQITIKARPYIFILFASLALVEKILIEVALKYDDILRSTIVCFSLLPLFSSLCAFSNVN